MRGEYINMTFQLDQYFEARRKLNEYKKKYREMKENNQTTLKLGCCTKTETKEQARDQIIALKENIKTYFNEIKSLRLDLFTGVAFLTFNTNKEYSDYYDQYP